ncbi:MAG TPA: crossover junction endodeoxyribonuclease RuvC [Patescibacteria group bacterium]
MTDIKRSILAIDPGYDRVGWAIGDEVRRGQLTKLHYGIIQTEKKAAIFDRYLQIQEELHQVIETYRPSELAIEQLYFSKNTTTALRVSEARGVIIASCLRHGLKVFEYNPGTIKLAVTGHGQANKAAVDKMVRLQLAIKDEPVMDDTMDALALLLTHSVSHSG